MPLGPLIRSGMLALALLAAVSGTPALGQTPRTEQDALAELDRVKAAIALTEQRRAELEAEIDKIGNDRTVLSAELIAAGRRTAVAEAEAAAAAEKLASLRTQQSDIRLSLQSQRTRIASVLASISRIGGSPPPALLVGPDGAMASARAATLLASILPDLRDEAEEIRSELDRLATLTATAETEEAGIRQTLTELSEEQVRIAALIEARRDRLEGVQTEIEEEQRQAEILAARATSLDQLISSIAENEGRQSAASSAAAAAAAAAAGAGSLAPETVRLAFADLDRAEPAVPISNAKGYLTPPVAGVRILDFGAPDGFGGVARGLSMVTRAEAQVLAPADGWVIYQGPYLNYGRIVILDAGLGFNFVLAGLEDVDIELHQFVLMGEPIGRMGQTTTAQTVATSAGVSRPTLYIELRAQGVPIDPSDWWSTDITTLAAAEQPANG